MRNNVKAQIIYRTIWLVIALTSTVLSFIGYTNNSPMLFYTNWSVWLASVTVIVVFTYTLMAFIKKEEVVLPSWVNLLKFAANIMIIATFIVSAFVLPDKIWKAGYWQLNSIFKHFLLPIVTVLDTCLFDKKGDHKITYPFLGVVLPLLYWIILIVRIVIHRNACGGHIPEAEWVRYYPYGFTNLDKSASLGGLIGLLAGILVGLILIGFAFYLVNNKKLIKNK